MQRIDVDTVIVSCKNLYVPGRSSEPGGQLVTERWRPGWGWYLAAARNFIVAEIDARGSGGQVQH